MVEAKYALISLMGEYGLLKITEIRETEAFFKLEAEWNSLLNKSKDDSVFLTWESQSANVKRFSAKQKLGLCV